MSRIGRKPINIPAGVEVTVNGSEVAVKGPKGTLDQTFNPKMNIAVEGNEILVTRPDDEKESRSLHGLTRTLIPQYGGWRDRGLLQDPGGTGRWLSCAEAGQGPGDEPGLFHQVIVSENEDIKIDAPNANTIVIPALTSRRLASLPPRSGRSVRRSPIRARAFAMPASLSAARKARPARALSKGRRSEKKWSIRQIPTRHGCAATRECAARSPAPPSGPRLNVFRSSANIYAQIIDDTTGHTLCAASTLDKSFTGNGGNKEGCPRGGQADCSEGSRKRHHQCGL